MMRRRPTRSPLRARLAAGRIAAAAVLGACVGGAPAAAQQVGVAAAVNPQSELQRGGVTRTLVIRENILFEDRIVTSEGGLAQVLFVDGSTFTIGPDARVVIDEFVFDPASGGGELVAEVAEGALRFVGGRLSKNDGTVRFRGNFGTLGVRGAIVEIDGDPPCEEGNRCPLAVLSLVFGEEIVLQLPDGGTRRVHEAGYAIVVFRDADGRVTTEVVPISELDQSSLRARLAGRAGASGGASDLPTDEDVLRIGLPDINSLRAPFVVLPRPRPQVITSFFTPEENDDGNQRTSERVEEVVVGTANEANVREDIAAGGETGIPTDLGVALTPPDGYDTRDGRRVPDPGNVNITGQRDDPRTLFSTPVTFVPPEGDTRGRILIPDVGSIPVPAREGITRFSDTALPGGNQRVSGSVFRGPDNFTVYYGREADPDNPDNVGYLFTGVRTSPDMFFRDAFVDGNPQVRTYELEDDFQRRDKGISSRMALLNPLIARAFGNRALSRASVTPYLTVDRSRLGGSEGNPSRVAQAFQAGLFIEGVGPQQRSAVVVDPGAVVNDVAGETIGIAGFRRGSYRLAADRPSVSMQGPTGSLSSDGSFDTLFGENGQNFIYTSGIQHAPASEDETYAFFDRQPDGEGFLEDPDETYSSLVQVARLVDRQDASALERSDVARHGFAAAILEPEASSAPFVVRTGSGEPTHGESSTALATIGGDIRVADAFEADPVVQFVNYAFGRSVQGSYVDDARFGAVATADLENGGGPGSPDTYLITDGGTRIDHGGSNPGTYVVSGRAVPQERFFRSQGARECECAFLDWGWWGSQTEFEGEALPGGKRGDFAHLGTWAVGDIVNNQDLPAFGTGTYAGHAVGNVVSGGDRYVAAGDMDMTYDFGARQGTLSITNFDGRDFSGTMTGVGGPEDLARFGGNLSGSGLSGGADGAFARGPAGPAQGVLGDFGVRGEGYLATGTFLGEGTVSEGYTPPLE